MKTFESKHRHVFYFAEGEFAGLTDFGRYHYTETQKPLSEHIHPGAFEFCYLCCGKQLYRVADTTYELDSGDLFFTLPDEVHSTGAHPEYKGELFWFILQDVPNTNWLNFTLEDTKRLRDFFYQSSQRRFPMSRCIQSKFEHVLNALQQWQQPFGKTRAITAMTELMLCIIENINHKPAAGCSAQIADVLAFINHYPPDEHWLKIEELAARTHLSVSRFKSRFKQEVGFSPADYILRQKIDSAKSLLSNTDQSIIDIALMLGFSSSQYFATVFKRYQGQTPSEFRLDP